MILELYSRCVQLFDYCDGVLIRRNNQSPNARIGTVAGYLDMSGGGIGYFRLKIDRKSYLVHRIIYLMHHKKLPDYVDHRDGNTHNNRISNLREATKRQNRWNCKGNDGTYSGVKGVYLDGEKWKAMLTVNGERHYLGMYDTILSAKMVVDAKYAELQGLFSIQHSVPPNTPEQCVCEERLI